MKMRRRLAIFLALILVLAMLAGLIPLRASALDMPTGWAAPDNLSVGMSADGPYALSLYFQSDPVLLSFLETATSNADPYGIDNVDATVQVDWRMDDGAWHYTTDWDRRGVVYGSFSGIYPDTGALSGTPADQVTVLDLRNDLGRFTSLQTQLGSALLRGTETDGTDNRLNLLDHTFTFRLRFHVRYHDKTTMLEKYVLSPWSETLLFGKNAATLPKPAYLAKPTLSTPVREADGTTRGAIGFHILTPLQVTEADNWLRAGNDGQVTLETAIRVDEGEWHTATSSEWHTGTERLAVPIPEPDAAMSADTYDPEKAYVQVRVRYVWEGNARLGALESSWSNLLALNPPAWNTASAWAIDGLRRAETLQLIPDMLSGSDPLTPITREEFCELAVRLYETQTGNEATPAAPNPFRDTSNPQVLKAITLGITVGVNPTTFQPGTPITREQCALMLFRTLQAIEPDKVFEIPDISGFRDEAAISSWARDAVAFMSNAQVILGNGAGLFMPRPETDAQRVSGYGMATREAAILLVLRTYNLPR